MQKQLILFILLFSVSLLKLLANVPQNEWIPIFQGIEYQLSKLNESRNILIHQIRIDLKNPDISFFVTPIDNSQNKDLLSDTTSNFLKKYDLQIAVNGQGFGPPKPLLANTPKRVCGFAISNGLQYGRRCKEQSMFAIFKNGSADIINMEDFNVLVDEIHMAIGGWTNNGHPDILVSEGKTNPYYKNKKISHNSRAGRTALGITADKKLLYLVVAEHIKGGIKLFELAQFMQQLGSFHAINLDGGTSSTMVIQNSQGEPIILNSLRKKLERPVANHLGVFAAHLQPFE